ncbi:MAG TPA: ATP synthase subunit I [Acidimicrobiales bacterium]
MSTPAPTFVTRDTGPPVEQEIARDMLGRAAWFAPVLVAVCAVVWGIDGGISSAYAVVLVLVNFLLSAALLSWAARISLALLMGAAMGGYLLRLALVAAAVLLVKDQPWVDLWALGLTLIVTHLGLLLWELRYVSASLAFPGLKPAAAKENRNR